ncbi:envelope stress response protein PspG [Vibrio sp. SCSIO 43136]|uniref:envelope stress response protein PspG n=1 Tax=Vibrio sp. SCSIO 43136 TaxID=2819101 RepID=UPI0020764160|nr:envelope stress response protein PspG [Vibrio sp. SCSIO 43136]USD65041.1 envelope stress response protein PspG [Vibrio sp. SCSIO 43136]
MFELLFVLMFLGILVFTGVTMMTVFAAGAITFVVMLLLGMVGFVFKILPWIIVIALGWWFFKNYVYCPR